MRVMKGKRKRIEKMKCHGSLGDGGGIAVILPRMRPDFIHSNSPRGESEDNRTALLSPGNNTSTLLYHSGLLLLSKISIHFTNTYSIEWSQCPL